MGCQSVNYLPDYGGHQKLLYRSYSIRFNIQQAVQGGISNLLVLEFVRTTVAVVGAFLVGKFLLYLHPADVG